MSVPAVSREFPALWQKSLARSTQLGMGLNPIEQVFAKLNTLLRKAAERTVETTWKGIGTLLDAFSPQECANYFRLWIRFNLNGSDSRIATRTAVKSTVCRGGAGESPSVDPI